MQLSLLGPASVVAGYRIGLAKTWLAAALFTLGNMLVPLALHAVPNAGQIFLPIFFFTLIGAGRYGLWVGLLAALASPALNHAILGMPAGAMFPVVAAKGAVLALAAFGLSRIGRGIGPVKIALAVIAMELAGLAAEAAAGIPFAGSLAMLRLSLPGLAILVAGGYAALRLFERFAPRGQGERR